MADARWSSALLLLITCGSSLVLTACSDHPEAVAKRLIGKWQCTTQTIIYADRKEENLNPGLRVEFLADGSYQAAQGQATSRGTYKVIDVHHYTYQVTQSDHGEQVGRSGTTEFSVLADQLQVLVPGQGKESPAIKRIETTCQRQ